MCSAKNRSSWAVRLVTVSHFGIPENLSPQQGPDMAVPDGHALMVKMRLHSTARTGYVANSAANTEDDDKRVVMQDGDAIRLFVTNANLVWFYTNLEPASGSTEFEVIAEQ